MYIPFNFYEITYKLSLNCSINVTVTITNNSGPLTDREGCRRKCGSILGLQSSTAVNADISYFWLELENWTKFQLGHLLTVVTIFLFYEHFCTHLKISVYIVRVHPVIILLLECQKQLGHQLFNPVWLTCYISISKVLKELISEVLHSVWLSGSCGFDEVNVTLRAMH